VLHTSPNTATAKRSRTPPWRASSPVSTGGDFHTAILPRKLDETPFVWPMLDHYRKHKQRVTKYVAKIPKEHMANWCCSRKQVHPLAGPASRLYDKQIEGIPLGRYYPTPRRGVGCRDAATPG